MHKIYTMSVMVLILALLILQSAFAETRKPLQHLAPHSLLAGKWITRKNQYITPFIQQRILISKAKPSLSLEIYLLPKKLLTANQIWQQTIDYMGNSGCQLQSASDLIQEKNNYFFLADLNQCPNNSRLKQFYLIKIRNTALYMYVLNVNPRLISLDQQASLLRQLNMFHKEAFF